MGRHVICEVDELPAGARKLVTLEGKGIGVFNVNGNYYALRNVCPHQGAPLCAGKVTGMTLPSRPGEYVYGREGEIVRCPWHGWEFDIASGTSIFDPFRVRVKTYDVDVLPCEREAPPSVETFPVKVEVNMVVVYV